MDLQLDTKPLLRPAQLADAQEERDNLTKKLSSPHIQDKGEVARQLRRLNESLNKQTPREFGPDEIDAAVKREAELRADWLDGMPSHEEMRKNPPGATDKHMAWERAKKQSVLLWKNLMQRLHAGSGDGSVSNIEKYRPRTSSLNMDNAQIAGTNYFLPPPGAAPSVIFNDAELAILRTQAPDVALKLPLLSNEQRAEVKKVLDTFKEG